MRRAPFLVTTAAAALWLTPALAADDPVLAVVNGEPILQSEVEAARANLPEQYRQMPLEVIFEPLLNRVIDQRLLAEEAERRDLASDPEVQAELDRARAQVLQQGLFEKAIQEGSTEERLQQAYDAMRGQPGFAEEEVHAHHILVETEEAARELIGKLGEGGEFATLAGEASIDPSAQTNAGDLGWFTRGTMVQEFAEAAFAIEPGTIGEEPVQSQFGWHVIKVDERRTRVPSFAEKESEIREQVAREIVTALLDEIRSGAEIERFALDGSPQPD
jgi:peptidyl-prolyl cis-trans isomerase C